jgi:hypothetical protein
MMTAIISIIGYIDFRTGEVSLDILYIITIGVSTWYFGTLFGIASVVEILIVKISADYFDNIKLGTHQYDWNAFSDFCTFIFICVLVGGLKKALDK